ncbi:Maternal protein pumilio [Durusdinium trenchii]|uniref:Maternal protein pumilio n=1 Tax=Durusdinium trenchii TaxID=1381693 RepID=A0ABP0N4K1_9DINO
MWMPRPSGAEQCFSRMQVIHWVPKTSTSHVSPTPPQILLGPVPETLQIEMSTVLAVPSAQDVQRFVLGSQDLRFACFSNVAAAAPHRDADGDASRISDAQGSNVAAPVEGTRCKLTCSSWATSKCEAPAAPASRMRWKDARGLRRKRALERSRGVQHEHGHVRHDEATEGTERCSCNFTIDELRVELRRNRASGMQRLRGQVWRLSRDAAGCRLVQEALESGGREAVELAHELQGHVLEAVMCPHANYVVQKVVSHLSVAASSFVVRELQGNGVRVAKHRFACRIFCRLLEFGTSATSQLVDELLETGENLCTHSFAHHVIQSILEHGEERHKHLIAKMLTSELWTHATHKNSSYLIEKGLDYFRAEDQDVLVTTLGKPEALLDLAMHKYGSFVARSLLQDSRVNVKAALRHLQDHQVDLKSTKHGHRFLADVALKQ